MVKALFLLLALCFPASAATVTGGDVRTDIWRIRGVAVSTGTGTADSGTQRVTFALDGSSIPVNSSAFTVVTVSTAACAATATLVLPSNSNRTASLVCNEGADAVRVGPSSVSATVGLLVIADSCVGLDNPNRYTGALYCIRTGDSDMKISAIEGTP